MKASRGSKVTAVDKGVLKTFLMSRSPIKGFDAFERAWPPAAGAGSGLAAVEPDRGIARTRFRMRSCGRC